MEVISRKKVSEVFIRDSRGIFNSIVSLKEGEEIFGKVKRLVNTRLDALVLARTHRLIR